MAFLPGNPEFVVRLIGGYPDVQSQNEIFYVYLSCSIQIVHPDPNYKQTRMDKSIKRSVFFLFLLLPFISHAQKRHQHDSIMNLIQQAEDDSLRALQYLELGDLYAYSHQDSAVNFYQKAFRHAQDGGHTELAGKCLNYIAVVYIYRSEYDTTIHYLNRSIDLMKKAGDKGGMANGYNNLGVIYKNRGNFEKAIEHFRKTASLRQDLEDQLTDPDRKRNNTEKLGQAYNNQGNIYYQFGDYSRAIEYYRKALGYFESIGDSDGISACYNNMGNVFEEQKSYDRATRYYEQALKVYRKQGDIRNMGTCLNNLGEVHLKREQIGKAREYFEKSLQYRKKANDKRGISAAYSNLAMVSLKNRQYDEALDRLHQALKLDNEVGDKKGVAEDLINLSRVYMRQDRLNRATDMAFQGLSISDSLQAQLQKKNALRVLAQIFEKKEDYKRSLEYTRRFEDIEDQLFNREKNQLIEELETKYQVEQKRKEIQRQEKLLEQKENLIRRQQVQKYAYIGGIVFVLAISGLIFFSYRQKRKANALLKEQKEEIESQNEELLQQNEEIRHQRDELERQRNLAHEQRNELEIKKEEITMSLRYARLIQSAWLPGERAIRQMLPGCFIFFKSRKTVSSDFYWVHAKDGKVVFAVANAGGGGLQGGFISLLGISSLKDAVTEKPLTDAGQIMNRVRMKMVHTLQQESAEVYQYEGMEMALCIWDQNTNTLQFSGARRPLYLIRNGELYEYPGQPMDLGTGSRLEDAFTGQVINIREGDQLYLFTDGYPSQISQDGQEEGYPTFKSLLEGVSALEPAKQKITLAGHFDNRQDLRDHFDDALVMGVRF